MIAQALEAFPGLLLSVFFIFCRIGACLMLVPGFGSARVPVQVRLFFSLGASVAIFSAIGEFDGERKRNFVGQHFWARGFFVNTVGRDEEAIRAYIRNQEKEDKRLEQMNLWR